MLVHVEISPLLPKYVPGYDRETGIVLDQAHGQTVLQILEKLNTPAEKFSNITIVVKSYPKKPKSVAAEAESITLTKVIGGGEPPM